MDNILSCQEISEILYLYCDGTLESDEIMIIEKHIENCQECRTKLENIKEISALIKKSSNSIDIEKFFITENVMERLNNENKISCNEVLEHISEYHDGEVKLKLHYLIEEHLENCPSCQKEYKQLEKLSYILANSGKNIELKYESNNSLQQLVKPDLKSCETCDYVLENLSAYLDKELNKDELITISEHLMECRSCRRDYNDLKKLSYTIREYFGRFEQQVSLKDNNIAQKLALQIENTNKIRFIGTSVAAIVILAVLSWFSITMFEPLVIENTQNNNQDRPKDEIIYVKAEDYVLKQAYAVPQDGVLAVIYEN